ncbi:MAG: ABC transporter ATP-binding protein [Betaproteobacteria bacterium]|nr:ABC transporter ATP-binding protein [Betaproteobacteria bacterium]
MSRTFGGLRAVRNVGFDLAENEILGIIGPNGAGKSTLFNMIAGFEPPDAGSVRLLGEDITGWAPERVSRAGLVRTFQTSRPFTSMSFADNVAVGGLAKRGSVPAAQAEALRCLELVGLADKADHPARGASTGQRKRLDIARALAAAPRVMLLDEPFGGVDYSAVDGLVALLKSLRGLGVTVLLIEHNIEAVHRLVDRVIAMDLGEIIAQGSAEAVTADKRVVEAYLGVEAVGDA